MEFFVQNLTQNGGRRDTITHSDRVFTANNVMKKAAHALESVRLLTEII